MLVPLPARLPLQRARGVGVPGPEPVAPPPAGLRGPVRHGRQRGCGAAQPFPVSFPGLCTFLVPGPSRRFALLPVTVRSRLCCFSEIVF